MLGGGGGSTENVVASIGITLQIPSWIIHMLLLKYSMCMKLDLKMS